MPAALLVWESLLRLYCLLIALPPERLQNLNVKGMVRNRKLSSSISDVGWGMFVNFLDYKLKHKEGQLVEIGRFFPSSKTCSCCGHVVDELLLDIREWDCSICKTHHDRDGNAALNIRNEGIRILSNGGGNPVIAVPRRSKTNKPLMWLGICQ